MKSNLKFFKSAKSLPIDIFFKMYSMIEITDIIILKYLLVLRRLLNGAQNIKFIFWNYCYLAYFNMARLREPKIFNIVELGPGTVTWLKC